MSRFTLLSPASKSGRVYKSFKLDDKGVVTREKEAPGTFFNAQYRDFENFQEMCDILTEVEAEGNTCILRGDISQAMEARALAGIHVRRTKFPRKDNEAGFQPANRDWVMIDIDKFEVPEEDFERVNPALHPDECITYLMERLPPYFAQASCWWQFSASQSVFPNSRIVKAHLFFMLDRPVSDVTMRRWAESQSHTIKGVPIDHVPFDCIQPHYIAPPRFVGTPDPLKLRSGIYRGSQTRVIFDVPPEQDVPFNESGGNVHPLIQMTKLKPYLDAIGDDPGQLGFNDAIKSVIGRYFQLYGPMSSDIPLKTAIRRAIADAPLKHDRPMNGPQSIEHYLSDNYLDPLVRSIRDKEHVEREAKRDAYADALGRYVYIEDVERFVDLKTMAFKTKMGVTDSHAYELIKLADAMLADSNLRRVSRITYKPGAPEFCEDYDPGTGKIFPCYNQYQPPTVLLQDAKDARWFVDHIEYMCDGEGEAVKAMCDWLAHLVQFPEEKINFGILLQGRSGTGKSALVKTMIQVLGLSNVMPNLPTSALVSNFTEWMQGKLLVCVEEIRDRENKFNIYNQMKDLIVGETVRINPKGLAPYSIPNRTNFICLTNYEDAVPMDDDDRRFIIHFSKAQAQSKDHYRVLFERISEYAGAVRRLLMERDISEFNPKGRAPMTDTKREYLKMSGTPIENYLKDSIEGEIFPCEMDLITIRDLQAALPSRYRNVSEVSLSNILGRIPGAKNLSVKRLPHGKMRVWALRNLEKWEQVAEKDIADYYQRPIADQTGGGFYQKPTTQKDPANKKDY